MSSSEIGTKDGLAAANAERRPHVWFLTGEGLREACRAGLAEHADDR